MNTLKWFLHLSGHDEHQLVTELRQSLEAADRTVIERARSNRAFHGMGTTLTMAFSVATDLFIVHAGDSRAYLFRDGELEQLTSDHTVVQVMVDAGGSRPRTPSITIGATLLPTSLAGPARASLPRSTSSTCSTATPCFTAPTA